MSVKSTETIFDREDKSNESQVVIKLATEEHSQQIWEWRNDPVTRSMFRSQDLVSWEDHSNWFQKTLKNPDRIMYVGINGNLPFGVVRFDSIHDSSNSFEISININPSERGKGLGLEILKMSLSKLKGKIPSAKKIIAEVKKENPASNRLFISSGFTPQQSNEDKFNSYLFTYHSQVSNPQKVNFDAATMT